MAQVLYYGFAGLIAAAAAVQITSQVFFSSPPEAPAAFTSCDQGVRRLYGAIERGRKAAEDSRPEESEEAALLRYREAVAKVWRHRNQVAALCQGDERGRGKLDSIERLRYSEEHGIRHQAAELTALRQRVRKMMAEGPEASAQPAENP